MPSITLQGDLRLGCAKIARELGIKASRDHKDRPGPGTKMGQPKNNLGAGGRDNFRETGRPGLGPSLAPK